ncbi:tape measure protein [Gordonia polyisoprenivorans]|uniref:aggregation-promoting factor C-terminal-like domain-containing protein n=1 Tax=Gordonia polyisoprenivorans TaxID=84595 RepID=UPI0022341943|nr:tape measure protein [Gordonia polyisoprenivorans]
MVELATAYISIVSDASGIPRSVRSALGQAEGQARQSGQRMGSTMSTALGTALGIGASKAVGAATSAISTALSAGFDRLNAIDQAKGKLAGLGNSTQTTARVMDSALASVKGTAFGLGDAATIAASAIAAGIKPGQDLTKYLSMTADAATIAGSSLGDMGSILNGVQTSGNAMNDSLGQLADRGIPIYQWLGEEMGVTAGEVEDLASKGKVSSEVFFAAIQKNIGGAALESGKTVQGSFNNVKAALGRLGAAVEEPGFTRLPGFFTDLTARIDAFTPKAKEMALAFDSKVFDEWGPKIQDALAAFEKTGSIDEFKTTLKGLADALVGAGPAVAGIASSLAQASAALGVSGWQLFLTALQAAAGVLNAINPLLSGLSSLMQSNQAAVTALVAAWFAFKTIPAIMGRVTTSLAPMGGALASARTSVSGFGSAWRTSIGYMQQANPAMSTFGAGVRVLGANAGAAAKGGLGMLRNAGSAVAGVFGGPVGLGLTAAAVGGMYMAAQFQEAKQKTEALAAANRDLVTAQHDVLKAFTESRGAVNDSVISAQTTAVEKYRATLDATAARHKSFMEGLATFDTHRGQTNALADEAEAAQRAFDKLGLSNEELTKRISRGDESRNQLRNQLRAMGPDGQSAARAFDEMSISYVQQQQRAQSLTPGIADLGDAIRAMGDQGASAGDKLNALKAAMDAMNPARNQTEALAQYGETIRKVADAAAGIDSSAIGDNGQINAMSEAGATLSRTLGDLADKSAQVASTGGDMAEVNRQNEQAFQALADATGQPIAKIRELYSEMGGRTVDLTVTLSGAPKVIQDLGTVSEAFARTPNSKTVTMEAGTVTEQTQALLQRMNATVTTMPNGDIQITANDAIAQQRILMVTQNINVLNALKANPTLDLNTLQFNAKDAQSRGILQQLNGMVADPQAGLIIQDLLNGQAVSMTKLDELRKSTANPNAILLIDELLKNAGIANTTLDQTARTRDANIRVNVVPGTNGVPGAYQFGLNVPAGADGMIRQYANGGINALEQYANGKLPNQAVLQKAVPNTLIQWAEPETGGEAFIPLAGSKRSRSTDILAAVAKIFGYALVPQDNLPSTVSGMLGSLTGNALSRMLSLTGVDKLGVTAYVNGGMDAAGLRKLAEGTGASRPLTGAPYVWGGVNWGDCCLVAETPVWGPDGATPIAELSPGQWVWSYVDGKLESHQVTAAWFSKAQEVFKVRTRHRAVTGSANHPFLRLVQSAPAKPRRGRRGWDAAEYDVEWARLDELRVGDLLVQPKAVRLEREVSNSLPSGRPIGPLEAWLLGVILGDGNVTDTKVEICVYGDLRNRARDVLSRMQLPASKTRGTRDGIGTSDSDAHGIRAYSVEFARELAEAGFRKPAHEKRIPDCVWGWDEDRQRAFLNGYCDADGHHPADVTRHGERTYASASRALIEDVRYLHIALGDVVANVTTNRRRKPIVINGKQVKTARPLHIISVRADDRLVSSVAAERRPGVAHWTDTTEFAVAPVLSITSEGVEDTYDIEVEGSHNFIAGGVVVHNSGAMSAFARAAVGLDPFGGRFATASEGSQLQSMGFTLGQGSSGDLRFGWYNGGAGGGHTAGTLPDGTNIEMGGNNGGGALGGGAAGADSPQFTDHAFLTIGPGLPTTGTGATDPGGFVTRPDGTIVYQPGNGNYGATGGGTGSGSGSTTGSGGTSISSRFGSAVGAFVEGQIADVFQTLGANDSPGIVGAIADYENAQRSKQNGQGVDTTALKTSYENAKKESDQKYEAEKLKRKQDYDEQVRKLQAEKKATKDAAKKAEIDRKLADLKKKHEDDELAKKQEHDNNQLDAKQKYDQATKTANSANSAAGQQDQQNPPTDPGTSKPAPGQDLGGAGGAAAALASTGNQIKDAFRSGLREAWRTGQPWTDTDYIVGKESGWKVDATNPSSGAFGLGQWNPSSGTLQKYLPDKSTDPTVQGKAFDRYVNDVYTDPMGARAHWDQYGWYDRGGIIHEGTTLMRNDLGHKETALPFDPRDLKASLDRGAQGVVGTDQIIAKLDQLITVVAKAGLGGVNVGSINGMSPEAVQRRLQDMQRRQMMRASQ